jgi:hypothetical protein
MDVSGVPSAVRHLRQRNVASDMPQCLRRTIAGREAGREGGRQGGREGGRQDGRMGGREGPTVSPPSFHNCVMAFILAPSHKSHHMHQAKAKKKRKYCNSAQIRTFRPKLSAPHATFYRPHPTLQRLAIAHPHRSAHPRRSFWPTATDRRTRRLARCPAHELGLWIRACL